MRAVAHLLFLLHVSPPASGLLACGCFQPFSLLLPDFFGIKRPIIFQIIFEIVRIFRAPFLCRELRVAPGSRFFDGFSGGTFRDNSRCSRLFFLCSLIPIFRHAKAAGGMTLLAIAFAASPPNFLRRQFVCRQHCSIFWERRLSTSPMAMLATAIGILSASAKKLAASFAIFEINWPRMKVVRGATFSATIFLCTSGALKCGSTRFTFFRANECAFWFDRNWPTFNTTILLSLPTWERCSTSFAAPFHSMPSAADRKA
jgi:hypothetical protein